MFPAAHGVVSQGGKATEPESFTPQWASLSTPGGGSISQGTVGWAFTVTRPLKVTRFRVHSSNATSTNRRVRVIREPDEEIIAEALGWTTTGTGWQEIDATTPGVLVPGVSYVLVTARPGYSINRLNTQDHSVTPWMTIPEVTFIEGRSSANTDAFRAPDPTNIIRGVDMWLEAP